VAREDLEHRLALGVVEIAHGDDGRGEAWGCGSLWPGDPGSFGELGPERD